MRAGAWLPIVIAFALSATAARADDLAEVGAWNADPALASAPFPLAPVPAAPTEAERTYAVHAAMLPTGKVLFYGMVPSPDDNASEAYLWDPARGYGAAAFTHVPIPEVDVDGDGIPDRTPIYCSGQSFLPDGRLLVTGGNLHRGPIPGFYLPAGTRTAFTFDPWTETWTRRPDLAAGRYYPTQTELADGRTIVLGGYTDAPPGGITDTDLEVYSPDAGAREHAVTGDRTNVPGPRNRKAPSLYPRMFLMPDERVLLAGSNRTDAAILDPGKLSTEGDPAAAWTELSRPSSSRHGDMAVLVPSGPDGSSRVLALGGWTEADPAGVTYPIDARPALATSESVDGGAATPVWSRGPDLAVGRSFANSVLLPDGTVATVGGGAGKFGVDDLFAVNPDGVSEGVPGAPLRHVELLDPKTGEVRLGPAQAEDRAYHSTALLLPDGRVFSGGDNLHPKEPDGSPSRSDTGELYSPPYLFRGPRPEIDGAPDAIRYRDEFAVRSASPDVTRAVLVAPGATTHSFDMGQRFVPLRVTRKVDGTGLDVVAPPSPGVAPPGYYMLWLLNARGVPSIARWLRLGPDAGDQPSLPAEPPAAVEPTPTPTPGPAPTAEPAATPIAAPVALSVTVIPRRARVHRRTGFTVTVRAASRPVAGARVRLGGRLAGRTGRQGRTRFRVTFGRPGRPVLTVTATGHPRRRVSLRCAQSASVICLMARELPPSLIELEGLVAYAERRVALQKRKIYAGGGEPRRLAELERVHAGATKRLALEKRRRRAAAAAAGPAT